MFLSLAGLTQSAMSQTFTVSITPLPRATTNFPVRDDGATSIVLFRQSLINSKIRGYYTASGRGNAASGNAFYVGGGSINRFTLQAPIPSSIAGLGPTVTSRVGGSSFLHNMSKSLGPQALLLDEASGLIFVGATNEFMPEGLVLSRRVSVLLSEKSTPFGEKFPVPLSGIPPTLYQGLSHLPTDLKRPTFSGRGPEGMALLDQGNFRYVFVNNYHEGTATVFVIDSNNTLAIGPRPVCEFDVDKCPTLQLGYFPEPEGNLNRPMAVVAVPPCPGGGGVTYLLAGLNFDPPIAGEVPPFTTGFDGDPDEGATDYLMLFDVTNFDPQYATTCVPPTALPIPLGNSNQGTIVSIAIHPDRDVAYVVSSNFGTFYQNEEEDAWLYAVDLCQRIVVSAINLTAAQPTGLGLPNPTAEKIVAVHNGNFDANPDRLYIGTGPGGSGNTADGHMLVFDISGPQKLVPALLKDVDLSPHDTNPPNTTPLHLAGLVAVPGNSTFLGVGQNDLKRNVILGVGTDYDPTVQDRFVVFEDR